VNPDICSALRHSDAEESMTTREFVLFLGKALESKFCAPPKVDLLSVPGHSDTCLPCCGSFRCKNEPKSPIPHFLEFLVDTVGASCEALVLSMRLLGIVCQRYGSKFPVYHLTVHRMIMTCLRLQTKCVDDNFLDNKHFAAAIRMEAKDLNGMEIELWNAVDHKAVPLSKETKSLIASVGAVFDDYRKNQNKSFDFGAFFDKYFVFDFAIAPISTTTAADQPVGNKL
jgi:hypothetical protein